MAQILQTYWFKFIRPTGAGYIQANRFVGFRRASDAVDFWATAEVSGVLLLLTAAQIYRLLPRMVNYLLAMVLIIH
jgi:hypothetical protein